jgi:hypothetical protein
MSTTFQSLLPAIGAGLGLAATGGNPMGAQVGSMAGQAVATGMNNPNKKKPDVNDDMRLAYLEEIKKRLRDSETGRMYKPLVDDVLKNGATFIEGMSKVSGGNAGAYMAGVGKVQSGTNSALNQISANRIADVKFFEGLKNSLIENVAKRKADIEQYDWVMSLSQNAANQSALNKNMQGFFANNNFSGLGGGAAGGSGAGASAGSSAPVSSGAPAGGGAWGNNVSFPGYVPILNVPLE